MGIKSIGNKRSMKSLLIGLFVLLMLFAPSIKGAEQPKTCNAGLTVYLGGAGTNKDEPYIIDQVRVFREKYGINAVAGDFSLGREADLVRLSFYLDRQKTSPLPPIKKLKKAAMPIIKKLWERRKDPLSSFVKQPSKRYEVDWSLKEIGVHEPMPTQGQFNLIGFSFGSLIAAQSAIYYADKGKTIDYLVLIGSPISERFLKKLKAHENIGKVIIIDLKKYGDPLYAGMPLDEFQEKASAILEIASQSDSKGEGHFYYTPNNELGRKRRSELAGELFDEGLR